MPYLQLWTREKKRFRTLVKTIKIPLLSESRVVVHMCETQMSYRPDTSREEKKPIRVKRDFRLFSPLGHQGFFLFGNPRELDN